MNLNPYAAPQTRVADERSATGAPALWNPNAAASWSLLFSPAFGSFLHMLNWRALGNAQNEAAAKSWFFTSLIVLAMFTVCALMVPESKGLDLAMRGIALGYLLVWYFSAGRVQVSFVKQSYGAGYPRKAWGKPLSIALLAVVGYMVAMVVLVLATGAAK